MRTASLCPAQTGLDPERRSMRRRQTRRRSRTTVDGEVGPPSVPRRNHFLDCGIHRAAFAAYPRPGQEPKQTKARETPAECGGGGKYQIDTQGNKEHGPGAEPVG